MDKRPVLAAAVAALVVLSLAWIAGFNFNERGINAFFVAYIALWLAALAYFFPFKDRK